MSSPRPHNVVNFGKYLLVERLGRGGMAEVWKAKIIGPAGFQRTLVVKRILPHLVEDPHFIQMFVAEARLSARLNHTNIVQVFELGDVNGEYFLAMEYVRGRDLVSAVRAQMQRGLPIPGMAAFVIREVCRALAYAHSLGDENGSPLRLIHRDVSPSNVMLAFDGAVKLLDFGIAKALADANENKTQTGTLKGKFGYMSPEQVEGKDIDHRADLFAAGVVLHEVLTGRRLFKGASDLQTLAMVRDAKIDAPSKQNPNVSPELDRICLKALAKDLDQRYRNCEEMAADLDDVVHELKWGAERLAGTMRDLFPDDAMVDTGGNILPNEAHASGSDFNVIRRNERRRRYAFGATGFATLAGIVWLVTSTLQPTGLHQTAHAQQEHSIAPMRELPANVSVEIDSSPVGADVTVQGEAVPRGKTPLALSFPRSDSQGVGISLSLKGYASHTLEVLPLADRHLPAIVLEKLEGIDPAAGHAVAVADHLDHGKKHPPAGKAQKETPEATPAPASIREGGIVDPFAQETSRKK